MLPEQIGELLFCQHIFLLHHHQSTSGESWAREYHLMMPEKTKDLLVIQGGVVAPSSQLMSSDLDVIKDFWVYQILHNRLLHLEMQCFICHNCILLHLEMHVPLP